MAYKVLITCILISILFLFPQAQTEEVVSILINNSDLLMVVQQPPNNTSFVPSSAGTVAQFQFANHFGSLGFLAHAHLAGKVFELVGVGSAITVNYAGGSKQNYTVSDVLLFYTIEPNNPYSDMINLNDPFTTLTVSEVFSQTYGISDRVILQTCLIVGNEDSWGRIFVIAERDK